MMNIVQYGLLLLVSFSIIDLSSSETDGTSTPIPPKPKRMSRKYYDAEIYTGNENGEVSYDGVPLPKGMVAKKYAIPYKHAGSGIMKKSGNNVNWNVWKGNEDNSDNDDSGDQDSPGWQQPPQAWNNDAWLSDPMTIMMLKNTLSEMKGEKKPVGFLEKLKSDPSLLLIAASIPISLLLAAVLPSIMNHAMNGNNIPTVTTTATGNTGRSSLVNITPYLGPILEAVGTFGIRSISNPNCMQRILCQVAQDKSVVRDSKYFKKAATVARFLSRGSWLENLGVKEFAESLSSGNCESIPCSHPSIKEASKSRYSDKVHSNSVKK